ncbi:MAG TPA: alpha-xylosidase, partial [Dysgonomonas sp.]|nr:alpha-xylosidase [Dysgonomonas sp.]
MAIAFLLPFFVLACNSGPYKKINGGIEVTVNQSDKLSTKKVRLEVVTDDIIRVTATPENSFPEKNSLITSFDSFKADGWEVMEDGENIILQTATTKALVSTVTGEVVFTDLEGNVLLEENKGGGKFFQNMEAGGKKSYTDRKS